MFTRILGVATVCLTLLLAHPHHAPAQDPKETPLAFTGRLEASNVVQMRSRSGGELLKIHFKGGQDVKKGDVLFELDSPVAKASLVKAEAESEAAAAKQAEARNRANRLEALKAKNVVSQEALDEALATKAQADGLLSVARAVLESARQGVEALRVRAPIDGKIGLPKVSVGNLVQGGDKGTVLATLISTDPMSVHFQIDEKSLLRLQRQLAENKGKLDDLLLDVDLLAAKDRSYKGKLVGLDNRLDPKSATIEARGVLSNTENGLMPGMAVRVSIKLDKGR